MSASANLALPFIEGGELLPDVTLNETLRLLDTLVQLAIVDRDLNAPPGSPAEGQRWIVKASPTPTGAWAGHGNHVAAWQDGVLVDVLAYRSGEHDPRAVVVGKHQVSLDSARREDGALGGDAPHALARDAA